MEGRPNILLVDDVAMFREMGALFLARSGRVTTAASGEEALAILRRSPPDVMLVDLFMPGLDGEKVCEIVKQDPELSRIPVILIIGNDDPKDWGRAIRAGANDVLWKPLSRAGLISTVNRFLASSDPRGLPRVPVTAPAELSLGQEYHRGMLRNLSRGGIFVETGYQAPRKTEIELTFVLPHSEKLLRPTAEVVWNRGQAAGEALPAGMGMRFIEIDGRSVRMLDDFVLEWFQEPGSPHAGSLR